jgi:hypothetical protein
VCRAARAHLGLPRAVVDGLVEGAVKGLHDLHAGPQEALHEAPRALHRLRGLDRVRKLRRRPSRPALRSDSSGGGGLCGVRAHEDEGHRAPAALNGSKDVLVRKALDGPALDEREGVTGFEALGLRLAAGRDVDEGVAVRQRQAERAGREYGRHRGGGGHVCLSAQRVGCR